MRPPRSVLSHAISLSWVRNDRRRRLGVAIIAGILCILSVYPHRTLAEADLLPKEPGGGLSEILSGGANTGLLSLGDLIGQRTSIEAEVALARSHLVVLDVIHALNLAPRGDTAKEMRAEKRLRSETSIEAIRGSIIQISVKDFDSRRALEIAKAYTAAIETRLGSLNLTQAEAKRSLAEGRLADAKVRLAKAQADLAQFRDANKLALPTAQLGAGVSQLAELQTGLQAKQVELRALQQFATPSNLQVQAAKAEIQALQTQIAAAETVQSSTHGGLPGMAQKNDEYLNLFRNEQADEILYGIYLRYLESTEIDEMTAQDSVALIDPPFISTKLQVNFPVLAVLVLLIGLAVTIELYLTSPPPGGGRRGGSKFGPARGTLVPGEE